MKMLSPRVQRLISDLSQREGKKSGCEHLLPEHVMLALVKSADGLGYILLRSVGINVLTYQLSLEQSIAVKNPVESFSDLPPSMRLRALLETADAEASTLCNGYIGTEHLVLAAVKEERSITARYFDVALITLDDMRKSAKDVQARVRSSSDEQSSYSGRQAVPHGIFGDSGARAFVRGQNSDNSSGGKKSFLDGYSRDITAAANNGELDPVVGRDKEIKRLMQILLRRTKNNPVLIGEPGVGKTAIVEGLAQRIASGAVPHSLAKKRILSLDMTALVAGTKYRGEFEERMKKMMKEVSASKNIILFVDEMHTIIGAGGPEGAMDASNILKPALGRGDVQMIGATTTKEYRKYVEKDSALERRFQVVSVDEPTDSDSEQILEGIKKCYEEFHDVVYDDGVIQSIVKFARRYVPDRLLPDKAIDILDEAGAAKKIYDTDKPVELAELEKSIECLTSEKEQLVNEQDYEHAALVRDKVSELKKKLNAFSDYWNGETSNGKRHVTERDVCEIISSMTGIPVSRLDTSESERLLHMEEELHKDVVGQEQAVASISGAIRRCRTGVSASSRPMGSFIFLGPTGVGKTKLAKMLAKFLFGSEDSLIRIDMSDYMEKHNASRLVGAPPGYIGYDEGGVLTEKVRRRPYSVVLLDEIEKAHTDVFNLLLQLLEEGELSDNFGHAVNFRNTVIIMTSNAGSREITRSGHVGFSLSQEGVLPYEEIRAGAMSELKKIMSPELLNRIDDIVVFNALSHKEVGQILDIQINELSCRLSERRLALEVSSEARDYLIKHGYEPDMGARPLRRLIQDELESPLSILLLKGGANGCDTVFVDCAFDHLSVSLKRKSDCELPAVVGSAALAK